MLGCRVIINSAISFPLTLLARMTAPSTVVTSATLVGRLVLVTFMIACGTFSLTYTLSSLTISLHSTGEKFMFSFEGGASTSLSEFRRLDIVLVQ